MRRLLASPWLHLGVIASLLAGCSSDPAASAQVGPVHSDASAESPDAASEDDAQSNAPHDSGTSDQQADPDSWPAADAAVEDSSTIGDSSPADAEPEPDAQTPPPDAAPTPYVQIVAPPDGATVSNPVTFVIEAEHVATVEILADDWSLAEPWDPQTNNQLTYTFSGVGYERTIRLVGYDSNETELADHTIHITVEAPSLGEPIGQMWNTYYYLAREADYSGADNTTLYDASCNPIATVPSAFSDSVCIEGSGVLEDGRVINYARTCSCGRECPTGGIICYSVLNASQFPWGMGSKGNPLEPLRSWAVDNDFIDFGTVLYGEQWDGVTIPNIDGIGGFVHDGCFRADYVGGWINGNHFDFFAGTRSMYRELEDKFPTHSYFDVYVNTPKCAYLKK